MKPIAATAPRPALPALRRLLRLADTVEGAGAAPLDARDPERLQVLYRETAGAAVSKVARLVGRRDVAEEIVQEAFLKLFQAGLRFPSAKQAYGWIYKTCHNAGIDHLRAATTRRERGAALGALEAVEDERPGADGAGWDEGLARRQELATALAHLDEREAQVLAYRVVDGMTQDEIAEVLAVSRKTVDRTMARLEAKMAKLRTNKAKEATDVSRAE